MHFRRRRILNRFPQLEIALNRLNKHSETAFLRNGDFREGDNKKSKKWKGRGDILFSFWYRKSELSIPIIFIKCFVTVVTKIIPRKCPIIPEYSTKFKIIIRKCFLIGDNGEKNLSQLIIIT